MENKTDKHYSLKDAKDEEAVKAGFKDWLELWSKTKYEITIAALEAAAELYASKATEELRSYIRLQTLNASKLMDDNANLEQKVEELRKENEELRKLLHEQYEHPIARKEGFNEALQEVMTNLMQIWYKKTASEIYDEIEKLKR